MEDDYAYDSKNDVSNFNRGVSISNDCWIDGKNHTIYGNSARIFKIEENVSVTIDNLNFVNNMGYTGEYNGESYYDWFEYGGSILNEGTLYLNDCTFEKNIAGNGGAIHNSVNSYLSIYRCNFINNTADFESFDDSGYGGAISSEGTLFVDECSFIYNDAFYGGAIAVWDDSAYIMNSNFGSIPQSNLDGENSAAYGGAVYNDCTEDGNTTSFCSVYNSVFTFNSALSGGGIYNAFAADCTFQDGTYADGNADDQYGNYMFGGLSMSCTSGNAFDYENTIESNGLSFEPLNLNYNRGDDDTFKILVTSSPNDEPVPAMLLFVYIGDKSDDDWGDEWDDDWDIDDDYWDDDLLESGHSNVLATEYKEFYILTNGSGIATIPFSDLNPDNLDNFKVTVKSADKDLCSQESEYDISVASDSKITCSSDNIVYNYGNSGSATVTLEGATGFTGIVNGNSNAVKINGNTVTVSGLNAGTYNMLLTTIPQTNYKESSVTVKVTVNKVDSSINANDILFDYGKSGSTSVTLVGASGVTASIDGHSSAVSVSGNTVTVSGLDVGTYDLKIKTVPDSNHKEKSVTVKVTVNKADSSVSAGNVVFDYGKSGSTYATLTGATGVTASIDGYPNAVSVSGNTVTVSGLNVGTYDLKIKSVPDSNHKEKSVTVKVTVNKVNSNALSTNNLIFDYGGSDYTTLILDGCTGFTASVAGHPNTVRVSGNTVTVSGLDAGTYLLEVETIPDANHNSYKTTVPVTVNKANAVIEVTKLSAEYKKAKTWSIKLRDSNGNPLVNKEITLNVYTGNSYMVYKVRTDSKGVASFNGASKLSTGTHKVDLSISDSNYKANKVSSSIVITQKATKTVKLKLKAYPESVKKGTAITVTVKNGKKNVKNGIKVTVYVKKGKKDVMKPIVLKTVKRNGYSVVGFGTNKLAKGKYTAKFVVTSKGYSGQTTSNLVVKKKGSWQRIMK